MAQPANLANPTHDAPIPTTAARMDYLGAVAAGSHTTEELDVLRTLADEADAAIAALAAAPVEPWSPATPTSLPEWRPFIPEHIDATFAPAPGSHCECPTIAHIVLHIAECAQKAGGRAQPFGPDTCAEYGFVPNELIEPLTLGAALRGITVQGLADVMELEAEDLAYTAALTRGRTAEELEMRAANVQAYIDDPAVRDEFDRDQAESEAAEDEADALFDTLRMRMTVEAYDALFDDLDINDPAAVLERLRAEVAALPAPAAPFTVPPAPGAAQAKAAAPDVAGSAENPGPDAAGSAEQSESDAQAAAQAKAEAHMAAADAPELLDAVPHHPVPRSGGDTAAVS